jgi:outer membrane murein-binding lipoprotein Lpp
MNKITLLTLILLTTIFYSCGIPQAEVDKLNAEIETLKKEIDECENGADKLFGRANLYFDQKDFSKSKSELNNLIQKYPTSTEAEKGKALLTKIDSEIEKLAEQKKKEEIARKKAEEKRLANATKNMRKKYDDMNEITWYRDKSSPRYNNYNGFFGYFGKTNTGSPFLRLRIQYAADDWLFIERYVIKVDGITYEIAEEKYGEIETDNGSGGIWEWLDRSVTKKEMEIMRAVANGKDVKIRFIGKQYYKDKTINSTQKRALRNVIDAFEAMGGKIYL